jgi:hypothetical protein
MSNTSATVQYPQINTWRDDKWRLAISNLPSSTNVHDLFYFENFISQVTFPDYDLMTQASEFNGYKVFWPAVPDINRNLSQLQLTFKLDEGFNNYLLLFKYIQNLRNGQAMTDDIIRKNTIHSISIIFLDLQKRPIEIMKFLECFVVSISTLSLTFGSGREVDFTVNILYHELVNNSIENF